MIIHFAKLCLFAIVCMNFFMTCESQAMKKEAYFTVVSIKKNEYKIENCTNTKRTI